MGVNMRQVQVWVYEDQWDDFEAHCRKYHGMTANSFLEECLKRAISDGAMVSIGLSKRERAFFTREYYDEKSRLFKYTLYANILAVISSLVFDLIFESVSAMYILAHFLYVMSLALALLAFGLHIFRSAFRNDDGELKATAMGRGSERWVIWCARYCEYFWFFSVLLLALAIVVRTIGLLLPLG